MEEHGGGHDGGAGVDDGSGEFADHGGPAVPGDQAENIGFQHVQRHIGQRPGHVGKHGTVNPQLALSGFVHDVGKMVLNMSNDKLYNKVISAVEGGLADILTAERKYFDSDHVKTGSLLAKRWQLPILLANIISYHHTPSLSSIPVPCNLVCFEI